MGAIAQLGVRIPNDLALVGFDDFDMAEFTSPPLTVVRQPAYEMGRAATSLLFDRITRGATPHIGNRIVLPVEIVLRRPPGARTAPRLRFNPDNSSEGPWDALTEIPPMATFPTPPSLLSSRFRLERTCDTNGSDPHMDLLSSGLSRGLWREDVGIPGCLLSMLAAAMFRRPFVSAAISALERLSARNTSITTSDGFVDLLPGPRREAEPAR